MQSVVGLSQQAALHHRDRRQSKARGCLRTVILGKAEAAAGPSEDVPFYDPEYAGLLSAGFTKLIGV